ncbi:phosphoenolpyruvate carboxykinase (ATP) [candidate division KSB1 bacterium]|nr:phosphoenolpyruvate carboxykinase (ATP) [candidate division KSB1 bacterium]
MPDSIYKLDEYKRFYENLLPLLNGSNIQHPSMGKLRKLAIQTGTKTNFGSWGWRSMVSSRIAPKTVYLGSKKIRLPKLTDLHKSIIEKAPEELHKILHLLRTLPFVHIRRQMGDNDYFNPICNLYVCVADPKNYRLAYMWSNTLLKPTKKTGPEFIMIHIPEEHQLRQQVLAIPEHNLNIAMGSDYMGEDKKGFLRQAMWYADEHDMLGLHAGTKLVYVRNAKTNKINRYGIFLFGLSATGKTTWACHQLGLDKKGEKTEAVQDDIVFLRRDGSAYGSEGGFFVKTDVEKHLQEAMYYALIDKSALYENVMIDSEGKPDFLDENLCANGRAIIRKDKLQIKRGRKLVGIDSKSINLPSLEKLDGIAFAFITRRNTIMPFAQRLTAEQAVLAYLWGESSHSYASQPAKAGESVRIVGTDPFIIGSRAEKVNRFYDIIMELTKKYPGKVQFYQYNTGGVGEIIEEYMEGSEKKKRLVRKVDRVPINLMAAIQRGDLRGTNKYQRGILGTEEVVWCEGGDVSIQNPHNYYTQEQIDGYIEDLVEGRRKYTEEINSEGLKPEILKFAEESFRIAKGKNFQSVLNSKKETVDENSLKTDSISKPWNSKVRPPRPVFGR